MKKCRICGRKSDMLPVGQLLDEIVCTYKDILKNNLAGIYLHGSLAMNCFNYNSSDIDFLVAVSEKPSFNAMRKLVEVLLQLSENGPKKGFEMSVILEPDAKNFKYPTPFVLHYSEAHKERYLSQPDYICGDGEDPDLAAHIVITRQRGICLYGKPINQVFQPVPAKYYIESIMSDIASSKEDIVNNPIYYILNLCRVLNFLREGAVCSKKEGGEWASSSLPQKYKDIVKAALADYNDSGNSFSVTPERLIEFAAFMLKEIDMNLQTDISII